MQHLLRFSHGWRCATSRCRRPLQQSFLPADDAAHEDDCLCVCCLDAAGDTALAGCRGAHPPVVFAYCAAQLLVSAQPMCPMCRKPARV
jgi:hypothetical protein